MTDDLDWIAIANYLANTATPAERAALEQWVRERPERERLLRDLREVWAESADVRTEVGEVDVDAAWRAVGTRMGDDGTRVGHDVATLPAQPVRREWREWRAHASESRPGRRVARWLLGAAAAAVVVAGAGTMLERSERADAPLVIREIRTERGQRAELRLGDGSRVVLGPDSRLQWPASFVGRARDVSLEGEALFDVAHDKHHPFRVHTAGGVAEDMGTQFAVRAYPDEPRVLVAVKEGAVAIAPARDSAARRSTLRAGDLALMASSGRLSIERGADVERYLAFASGQLVFQRTPMRDVAAELERWYDVQIVLADSSLGDVLVSASFRSEGLRDVLAMLTTTLDARTEWNGRTVTLHARS